MAKAWHSTQFSLLVKLGSLQKEAALTENKCDVLGVGVQEQDLSHGGGMLPGLGEFFLLFRARQRNGK